MAAGLLPLTLAAAIQVLPSDEDKAFMTSLYLDHRKRLYTFALRLCANSSDAEDAVQEAFLALIPKVSSLRAMEPARLSGYLYITLKNAVHMYHRKQESWLKTESQLLSDKEEKSPEIPLFGYTYEDLMETLPELPERDQTLLRMKYFLCQSDTEIAKQLRVKPESVRILVKRARQRLIKMLKAGEQ